MYRKVIASVTGMRRLRLTTLVVALCAGCASDNPAGPGAVTITETTSTTTTSTIAPSLTPQFVFAPTTPAALQPVFFNGFGSTPGRGTTITNYAWDFGDGGTATGQSVSHTFPDQALYVVTLTITNDLGDTAKISQIVGAIAPPVTTSIVPATGAAVYVGTQVNPIIPSSLTLFFQLLADAVLPLDVREIADVQTAVGDSRYRVTGTFSTPNGTTGTIRGELLGTLQPRPTGIFTGRLTANPAGCTATRNFSGPITDVSLQWSAGSMVSNTCATNPLGFSSMNLLMTLTPPATTTSTTSTTSTSTSSSTSSTTTSSTTTSSTTTTTSVAPPLTGGTITASPRGTGIVSVTNYTFSYSPPPGGGVPPYSYSWNFGDGSTASGVSVTHVFTTTGTETVIATVTDSRGVTAQTSTPVLIGTVAGSWRVESSGRSTDDFIDINQNQTTGTVDHSPCSSGQATVTVSNPRSLRVDSTLKCSDGSPTITYQGTLDSELRTWTGTITGGASGCFSSSPCTFTATRYDPSEIFLSGGAR